MFQTCLQLDGKLKYCLIQQTRNKTSRPPSYVRPLRPKYPFWYLQKERAKYDEQLTKPNTDFIKEVVRDTFGEETTVFGTSNLRINSPLKTEPMPRGEWNIKSIRSGLIGRKIGLYIMYTKTGKRIKTTMLQIADNHVIDYISPEEFNPPRIPYKCPTHKMKLARLLVGAESTDPQRFTKEYCNLFTKSGVMPKKVLARFLITPEAAIQPGTPLTVNHFKIGAYVDVRGLTVSRGFQGVMKRWGFHGQPATHGQTKTHRRPGCIGGPKARVWPGKKMPGHMGNRWRIHRGVQILRINTKYNVMWVTGDAIPGSTNSIVYIYDSSYYHRRNNHHNRPHFPTYYVEDQTEPPAEEYYVDHIFKYGDPTITYEPEK